jgi:hypothetical protein
MSNERIDLTEFEGMTEGPWHCCLPYNAETDTYEGDAQMKGGGDRVNGPVVLSQYQFARGTANQRADLRAMESCPDLIAELKKMYEREDELLDALQVIKEDLETGIAQGNIPINATTGIDLTKIRNFANDASK